MPDRRKYRMTRVADGEYLCLSNDGQSVWRFRRYEDGSAYDLVCDYEKRTFWEALSVPKEWFDVHAQDENLLMDSQWWCGHGASYLKTRKAAVECMLESSGSPADV